MEHVIIIYKYMNREFDSSKEFKSWNEQSQITYIKKQLILQCQDSGYSDQFTASFPYNSQTRQIDLGYILTKIFNDFLGLEGSLQIFYYNSASSYYVYAGIYPFSQKLLLKEQYVPLAVISVLFKNILAPEPLPSVEPPAKKTRKIRTIREALEKVGYWRNLPNQSSHKLTFYEAAKNIEIPKKTLDDYYSQIKLGQQYGFDFQLNLDQKVGVLRKFVRQNHIKKKQNSCQVKILQKYLEKSDEQEEEE